LAGRRREDLLGLLKMLEQQIERMDGPVTALAFSFTIGDVSRFRHSNQVGSSSARWYIGMSNGVKKALGGKTARHSSNNCGVTRWRPDSIESARLSRFFLPHAPIPRWRRQIGQHARQDHPPIIGMSYIANVKKTP
jgi:hypothetical protein